MMTDVMTKPHQLIASDRVEGTAVRRPNGDKIGHTPGAHPVYNERPPRIHPPPCRGVCIVFSPWLAPGKGLSLSPIP